MTILSFQTTLGINKEKQTAVDGTGDLIQFLLNVFRSQAAGITLKDIAKDRRRTMGRQNSLTERIVIKTIKPDP